ncbi:MAG: hypothetical protein ABIG89_03350 [Candidatus Woesearchaeota archaeon]
MDKITHKRAAEMHYNIAGNYHIGFVSAKDSEKKANMVVAAQNYFYCIINLIEMVFAKSNEHSFNHENRYRKITEKNALFSSEFKNLFNEVDRDLRNKVAYRAENGRKYQIIKNLADLAMKELNNSEEITFENNSSEGKTDEN